MTTFRRYQQGKAKGESLKMLVLLNERRNVGPNHDMQIDAISQQRNRWPSIGHKHSEAHLLRRMVDVMEYRRHFIGCFVEAVWHTCTHQHIHVCTWHMMMMNYNASMCPAACLAGAYHMLSKVLLLAEYAENLKLKLCSTMYSMHTWYSASDLWDEVELSNNS